MPPSRKPAQLPMNATADLVDEHRSRLEALRIKLEAELEVAKSPYVAGIARQLHHVYDALANLPDPTPKAESAVDRLVRQRAERLGGLAVVSDPRREAKYRVRGGNA